MSRRVRGAGGASKRAAGQLVIEAETTLPMRRGTFRVIVFLPAHPPLIRLGNASQSGSQEG